MFIWQNVLSVSQLFLAGIIAAGLSYYSWRRRHVTPWALTFALLWLVMTLWIFAYSLRLLTADPAMREFWIRISYVGAIWAPVFWLIFILIFTDRHEWLTHVRYFYLLLLPGVATIVTLVAPIQVVASPLFPGSGQESVGASWQWTYLTFAYLLVLLTILLLFQQTYQRLALFRRQSAILLLGSVLLLLAHGWTQLASPANVQIDLMSVAFLGSTFLSVLSITYFNLFGIMPIARWLVVDMMRDGVIVLNEQNIVLDLNVQAETILGQSMWNVIGRPLTQFTDGRLAWVGLEKLEQKSEASLSLELLIGEKYYDLQVSPVYDGYGRFCGQVLVLSDITKQKFAESRLQKILESLEDEVGLRTRKLLQANESLRRQIAERIQVEKALTNSEERYKHLLQSITDYIYTVRIVDGEATEVTHSPGCTAVTGYPPDHFIPALIPVFQIIHPDDRESVQKALAEPTLRGQMVQSLRHRIIHRDGSMRWVRHSSVPMLDHDGQYIGYDGLIVDITERVQAEQQLLLAEQLASLGKLSAALTHEINNPLQIIQGYLDLVIDFPLDSAEKTESLEVIRREIDRLVATTRRILNYTQATDEERQYISVVALMDEVLLLVRKKLEQQRIGVQIDKETVPKIFALPGQIYQVFLNLMINAIEASEPDSTISIQFNVASSGVVVSVINHGLLISENIMGRIFEPFMTTKPDGTGLGLWVSNNIVQQHGGHISLSNLVDGSGVCATVSLPIGAPAP